MKNKNLMQIYHYIFKKPLYELKNILNTNYEIITYLMSFHLIFINNK